MKSLQGILMTCSLQAQSAEEQQQYRIFMNKVKNQRSFIINGYFKFDMDVIGPVSCLNCQLFLLIVCYFRLLPVFLLT